MNYTQLKSFLETSINNDNLVTIAHDSLSPNLAELLRYCYDNQSIDIDTAQIVREDPDLEVITIAGFSDYLNLDKLPVLASLSVDEAEMIQIELIYPLPVDEGWKFSDSFPGLPTVIDKSVPLVYESLTGKRDTSNKQACPLDKVEFTQGAFVVTTMAQHKEIDPEQLALAWDTAKVDLKWGINFVGKMKPEGAFLAIASLFQHSETLNVSGSIRKPLPEDQLIDLMNKYPAVVKPIFYPWDKQADCAKGIPGILLQVDLGMNYIIKDKVEFTAQSLFIYSPINYVWQLHSTNPAFIPVQAYTGVIRISNDNGDPILMKMVSPIEIGSDIFALQSYFEGVSLDNLSKLAGLSNNDHASPVNLLPDSMVSAIETVAQLELTYASISVNYYNEYYQDPNEHVLSQTEFTVGFAHLDWHVWQDDIVINNIFCTFSFDYPLDDPATSLPWETPRTQIAIAAELHIENVPFNVYGNVYDSEETNYAFYAEMLAEQTIPLESVMQKYAAGVPAPSDLTINTFRLSIVPEKAYSMALLMAEEPNPWIIPLPFNKKLLFQDVSMLINYACNDEDSSEGELGGQLGCTISFGDNGLSFSLLAELHNDIGNTGWQLQGATKWDQEIPIGRLISDLATKFGHFAMPKSIESLILKNITLSFNTNTKDFTFSGIGHMKLGKVTITIKLDIKLLHDEENSSFDNHYGGQLNIGSALFELRFTSNENSELLQGSWRQLNNQTLGINDLITWLGFPLALIPSEFDLALTKATFCYDFKNETIVFEAVSEKYGDVTFVSCKDQHEQYQYFCGIAVGEVINLSNIPLINQVFNEKQTLSIDNLQIVLSSSEIAGELDGDFASENVSAKDINDIIGENSDYPKVGADGLPAGVHISIDLNMGGYCVPLSVSADDADTPNRNQILPVCTAELKAVSRTAPRADKDAQEIAADGTLWFAIEQKFGPVTFERIGIKYKKGTIWFALDAKLVTAGLTMELLSMSIGSPLAEFAPKFSLSGIGMGYKNPSLTIEGTFLAIPSDDILQYGGGAVLGMKAFSLDAIGSYAELDNEVSMFVFAQINRRFGGPPAFYVKGILGGFGYNSELRLPQLGELHKLPLISGLQNPDDIGGENATPLQALATLISDNGDDERWLTPSAGNIWMAAGLKFSTFELIESTALLVAQFGDQFTLSILGLSKGTFPKQMPNQMPNNQPQPIYAYIEFELMAYFAPDEGVISCSGALSDASYLLDESCEVTGGFAMYCWFDEHPHSGDFVTTIGGYSPYFSAPKWYPKVPRVGINWVPDPTVSIKGDAYFALTPSAVMAGGLLDLQFHAGPLRAWLKANADIVVCWNPFYFVIDIDVTVGASYTMSLFGHSTTAKVEMGCSLGLWGPETGGKVFVNWFIIAFTIKFGAKQQGAMNTLSWDEFAQVLPPSEDVVNIIPVVGLTPPPYPVEQQVNNERSTETSRKKDWVVRSSYFEFTTDSKVPCHQLYIGKNSEISYKTNAKKLNIRPMDKTELISFQRLYIERKDTHGIWVDIDLQQDNKTWAIDENTQNVPNALWGVGRVDKLSAGSNQMIEDQFTGFKLSAPLPKLCLGPGDIDVEKNLSYLPLAQGDNPLHCGLEPSGPIACKSDTSIEAIENIMGSVKPEREALCCALDQLIGKSIPNGDLSILAETAGAAFVNAPLSAQS